MDENPYRPPKTDDKPRPPRVVDSTGSSNWLWLGLIFVVPLLLLAVQVLYSH